MAPRRSKLFGAIVVTFSLIQVDAIDVVVVFSVAERSGVIFAKERFWSSVKPRRNGGTDAIEDVANLAEEAQRHSSPEDRISIARSESLTLFRAYLYA
jgi:hypothetical protein